MQMLPITDMRKWLSPHYALWLCLLGSASLLAGAFAFEYIGGLAPCKLCIWQRWPHAALVALAAIGVMGQAVWLMLLACIGAALTSSAIGLYHVGVEQGWWSGPAGCSGQMGTNLDLSALTDTLLAMPVVRCDEIAWQFLGLSMAGWNMVISAGIAGIAATALILPYRQKTERDRIHDR